MLSSQSLQTPSTGHIWAWRYAWAAAINLLIGALALPLAAAFNAASDGRLTLHYPIFSVHCWFVLLGGTAPFLFGLFFWLYPILKDVSDSLVRPPAASCFWLLIAANLALTAYLGLTHYARPALSLAIVAWLIALLAAIQFALFVFRINAVSLRPHVLDAGLHAALGWLLAVLLLRLILALGALITSQHDFGVAFEMALRFAWLWGFLGNAGLTLASYVILPFLRLPQPRVAFLTRLGLYNLALVCWEVGASWTWLHPYTRGRLILALAASFLLYAIAHLLLDLGLAALLLGEKAASTPRERLTRVAFLAASLWLLAGTFLALVISFWSLSPLPTGIPDTLRQLPPHLLSAGFFPAFLLGLYVPLTGTRSLAGGKSLLAWGALVLLALWLFVRILLTAQQLLYHAPLWAARYSAGWILACGLFMLLAWLLWVLVESSPRPEPASHSSPHANS